MNAVEIEEAVSTLAVQPFGRAEYPLMLERIYIGHRFRNDTERPEKLFEQYSKITVEQPKAAEKPKRGNAA
jgi:hypothetical protein